MDELIKENKGLKEEVEKLKKELYKYSHSQKEYYQKKKEVFNDTIISPIYYNYKYSINKILNPIKFNLLSLGWSTRKYALGGVSLINLKRTYLTKCYGVGFISLINDFKIKKPVCFFNRRVF